MPGLLAATDRTRSSRETWCEPTNLRAGPVGLGVNERASGQPADPHSGTAEERTNLLRPQERPGGTGEHIWVQLVVLDECLHSFDDHALDVEVPHKAVNRRREFESNFPLSIVLVAK